MYNLTPKNWQYSILSGVTTKVTDGSHYSPKEEVNGRYKIATVKDLTEFGFNIKTCKTISEEDFNKLVASDCLPQKNDILLSKDGTMGLVYLQDSDSEIPILSSIAIIRPNEDLINPRYLEYFLKWNKTQSYLTGGLSSGSALPRIVLKDLKKLPISYPDIQTQYQIGNLLAIFDHKIEVNYKIAKSLEEMAQVIFKEWFAKFKFPDHQKVEFVDSALGKIPSGWSIGVLKDFIGELESGKRPRGGVSSYKEGIPSIGAENISGLVNSDYSDISYIPIAFFESMNMGKIKVNDILIYKDGGVPGIFKVKFTIVGEGYPFPKAAINEHVFRLQANRSERQFYLYFWLNTHLSIRYFDSIGGKAAVPGINSTDLKNLPLLIPNETIVVLFDRLVGPIIKEVLNINLQNQILSKTRDLLLPKLMKGEIRV